MNPSTVNHANAILPRHVRPVFFSANELLLDLLHITQGYAKLDLESLLIVLCVADATMRPFMLSGEPEPIPVTETVDEVRRGSISRRMVSDKTGLARETVRRKVDDLVEAGLLLVDDEGRLRAAPLLGDPDLQAAVNALNSAVDRYRKRLSQFGIEK